MNSELTRTLFLASRGLERLVAIRSNPNHVASGEHGGEFTSGPGGSHGKHWAKRQRRKKRKKKTLERLRREGHRDIKELKKAQREERKDVVADHKSDWKDRLKEQRATRKEYIRDALKESASLEREHAKEVKELAGEHTKEHLKELKEIDKNEAYDLKHEHADTHAGLKASYDEQRQEQHESHKEELSSELASLKEGHRDALQYHKAQAIQEYKSLKEEQADERDSMRADQQEDRESWKNSHRADREELLGHLKAEIAEKFPGAKRKSARGGDRAGRSVWISDPGGVPGSADDRRTACWPSGTDSPGRPANGAPVGASQSTDDPRGICGVSSRADYANQTDLPTRSALGSEAQERRVDPQPRVSQPGTSEARIGIGFGVSSRIEGEIRRASGDGSRFPRSKIHKASSAEAIVAHVLKQRGWTSGWREGRLTVGQRLQLLGDARQYGRQWMRHEIEVFFSHHGRDETRGVENAGLWFPQRLARGHFNGATPLDSDDTLCRGIASSAVSAAKRLFGRMRNFVRDLIAAGAIALKGAELSAQEADQADQLADVQMRYLDGFEREIVQNPPRELAEPTGQLPGPSHGKPPMSPAQIGARAELYATSAWQGAQKIARVAKRRAGAARWERRILGHPKTEHCTDCPPLAALGWQPVGTLPDIGESECGPLCLCHFEYSDEVAMPEAKQPKPATKKRKPKPAVVPEAPKPAAIPEPAAQVETVQPAPTREEIDIEVKKWIAGEPSRLTVKVKKERAPTPAFELPEGYKFSSDDDRHDNP